MRVILVTEMVSRVLHRFKPAAPMRLHLLCAALMWSLVGVGLSFVGIRWTWIHGDALIRGLIAVAVILGLFKARFALRNAARRTIHHITSRGDGRCLGGFLSWRTWLVVIAMMVLGRLLRADFMPIPIAWVGLLYAVVGVALVSASVWLWTAWHQIRPRAHADEHVN